MNTARIGYDTFTPWTAVGYKNECFTTFPRKLSMDRLFWKWQETIQAV
jgi:hypothetical protein